MIVYIGDLVLTLKYIESFIYLLNANSLGRDEMCRIEYRFSSVAYLFLSTTTITATDAAARMLFLYEKGNL